MKNVKGSSKEAVYLCLLNMNCFGVGYFIAGLKKRGLIALAVNLGLIIVGHLANASKQPVFWAIVFLAVFIGMVVDLWLLIQKDSGLIPEKLTEKKYLFLTVCILVNLVFFGGFFAYRITGSKIIEKGLQAYEQNDYLDSFKYLYSANQLYRLSLNPQIVEIENTLNEVSVIVTAQKFSSQSQYEEVIQCVEKMHDFYPQSPKISFMNELAIENHMALASELQSSDQYQACHGVYLAILADYPEEADEKLELIDGAIAENYLKWGEYSSSQTDYENAIIKLEEVLNLYPKSPISENAYQSAAQAHYDYALVLKSEKEFSESFNHLQIIEDDYPKFESMAQVEDEMPDLLLQYGVVLRDEKQFLNALNKFEQIAQYTTDTDVLSQADEEMQETITNLANEKSDDGFTVINKAKATACNGNPVDHPAIDVLPEEQGTARLCNSSSGKYIPDGLSPGKPGAFRYVVEVEDADRRVQSCAYTGGYTVERWQSGEKIIIRKVKTGEIYKTKTFYGSSPDACEYEHWFSSFTDLEWGGSVKADDVSAWVETVLK